MTISELLLLEKKRTNKINKIKTQKISYYFNIKMNKNALFVELLPFQMDEEMKRDFFNICSLKNNKKIPFFAIFYK